jgi:Arc/MetJ family transcription regulator
LSNKARHDRAVALVERMLDLNKKKHDVEAAFRPAYREKTWAARLKPASTWELDRIEREIASTDQQIDELVYELYGTTDEERRIIENT